MVRGRGSLLHTHTFASAPLAKPRPRRPISRSCDPAPPPLTCPPLVTGPAVRVEDPARPHPLALPPPPIVSGHTLSPVPRAGASHLLFPCPELLHRPKNRPKTPLLFQDSSTAHTGLKASLRLPPSRPGLSPPRGPGHRPRLTGLCSRAPDTCLGHGKQPVAA